MPNRGYWVVKDCIQKGKPITKEEREFLDKVVDDYQKEITKHTVSPNGDITYALYMKDKQIEVLKLIEKAKVKE